MEKTIYQNIIQTPGKKIAVLIDPDKTDGISLFTSISLAEKAKVDFFLVGGSLLAEKPDNFIEKLKQNSNIPVVLFPGSLLQYSSKADAILFLSLISGRNPELLIGNHVTVSPLLKKSNIEVLATGYMLVGTGKPTSVEYISNTQAIPDNKADIATATAIAGELLGLKLIYMDAGSGAERPIPTEMIRMVKANIDIPLIIGGGLKTGQDVENACKNGADIVVVGNALEKDADKILRMAEIVHSK
ncbi:MAG: geranylgeranylglyceryl/heptaprenylglyceryl phosphate synthase [Bacteroidetes bacterium 4572_117]|nr:MAG: geranylgeranylglyceryl/heptaprenylglyceryl phosphate synthase [Bacteroidetes bacterium 4572_117]